MITIIAQNKTTALAIARATANDDEGNRYELPEYDGRKHNLEPDYKK